MAGGRGAGWQGWSFDRVVEDVARLIGIVNWTLGWGIAATTLVRQALAAPLER